MVMAGDTVWRCEKIFADAVRTGVPVSFEFSEAELKHLEELYPTVDKELSRVRDFLNCVILMQKKMPYEVSTIFRIAGTSRFSCRMKSELPVYD